MTAIIFPGQGSQFRGMAKDLFDAYPELTSCASDVLGYSIERLCVDDPKNELSRTEFTQPALYVANALSYLRLTEDGVVPAQPRFAAGHSLGEYNALLIAGAFDFVTGLKLIRRRGTLMSAASGGGMAALLGTNSEKVRELLTKHRLGVIDIANYNTRSQIVLSGPAKAISDLARICKAENVQCYELNVKAAFHSRYMAQPQEEFARFLRGFEFRPLKLSVISNATALPYETGSVSDQLAIQIGKPVLWMESIRYLLRQKVTSFFEVSPHAFASKKFILMKMIDEIRQTETSDDLAPQPTAPDAVPTWTPDAVEPMLQRSVGERRSEGTALPLTCEATLVGDPMPTRAPEPPPTFDNIPAITGETLGSAMFRKRYGLRYAYIAGAMYRGIASADLVIRMGRAGMLSYFGVGGLSIDAIERTIRAIKAQLGATDPWGMNLLAEATKSNFERQVVDLYLRHAVRNIEAAAFVQMTPALVYFRLRGLRESENGQVVCDHNILAKASHPEVARAYMSPAPSHIVAKLVSDGAITPKQAALAQRVPMSHDICVEADSGGHTDGGIPTVLLPAMLHLRQEVSAIHRYDEPICMGLAGGIGDPSAAAAAFVMGADFVLTGSINQCTVEAGTSDQVKDALQDLDIQDTDYAPAGDMFESGARVQVMKKGVFFPARAQKLFNLFMQYESLEQIPEGVQNQLQKNYFGKTLDEVWSETAAYLRAQGRDDDVAAAESIPKRKMAHTFKWYFAHTMELALTGNMAGKVNFQVHTGPALGAFNRWVKGTDKESWRNRRADEIGKALMEETARFLEQRCTALRRAG